MPTHIVKGQKLKLADIAPGAEAFEVGVQIAPGGSEAIDISCFGVDAGEKLSDDRYFIFYNQKSSPCGGLTMSGPRGADGEIFTVNLSRLPATIQRLTFTASLDGAGSMSSLRASRWQLFHNGQAVVTFPFSGADFGGEKAIMVADIYRKDGVWRLAAVGQGFNGGLSALLKHFGGEEITPAAPPAAAPLPPPPVPPPVSVAPPPPPPPPPVPVAPPPPPPPATAPVRLTKVTLDKQGASKTVSLKKGGGLQPIAINLKWDQGGKSGGLFGFGQAAANADLDLGCMVLMRDGNKGVIQPIGGYFGSRTEPPFIFLDKDDRSGASADGENLTIFRPDLIEKVLVFALIYEGTANFSHVNAKLTIREQDGSEIVIMLNNPDSNSPFCAISMIQRVGDGVQVIKEERYYSRHREADAYYKFGFQWTAGSK